MKRKMILVIALAAGMLTMGALSASAAEPCGKCADKQAIQQFNQETDSLSKVMKAKDLELREQYSYDSIDIHQVGKLEAELKELKTMINAAAQKHGISACCRS